MPASQSWEIRTDTGSDLSGGGYDPAIGTSDYTYPTSSPIAYSDLVIAATTTNVSSAARAFVAADVGNTISVTAVTGFTAGRYSVRSVASGIATLDRAVGTAGSTAGTGTLGGALATLAATLSTTLTIPTQGNTLWVRQNGTFHDLAGGITLGFGSSAATAFLLGYGTVRGDSGIPTLKQTLSLGTSNAIVLNGNGYILRGLIVDAQGTSGGNSSPVYSGNSGHKIERVKAMNASGGGNCFNMYSATLFQCEGTGGFGGGVNNGNHVISFCYFHDLLKQAVALSQNGSMNRCLITNIGADAVSGDVPFVTNCTFDNITGNAVKSTNQGSGISNWQITRNIFSRCSGYGMLNISLPLIDPASVMLDGNAFYSCTSGNRGGFGVTYANDIALSASPFVNAAGADYRLNNTAGGGAAVRGASMPAALLGLTTPLVLDLGVYEHLSPPLGLTINATGANPVLTWDADPRAATGYVISRGTTATNKADIATVALAVSTYTDTAVTSGTFFYGVASY